MNLKIELIYILLCIVPGGLTFSWINLISVFSIHFLLTFVDYLMKKRLMKEAEKEFEKHLNELKKEMKKK